jgi:hypothetical protein
VQGLLADPGSPCFGHLRLRERVNGRTVERLVLDQLSVSRVAVESLRVTCRSTRQILEVARYAMGSLGDAEPLQATAHWRTRRGASVSRNGRRVAFLAEGLRSLAQRAPCRGGASAKASPLMPTAILD